MLPRHGDQAVVAVGEGGWATGPAGRVAAEDGLLRLPTGGPYSVHAGGTVVPDVLVGDVWLLAGQSNMAGAGERHGAEPAVEAARVLGHDDRWTACAEPVHRPWHHPDAGLCTLAHVLHAPELDDAGWAAVVAERARPDVHFTTWGAGPGAAFARALTAATGVPVGLVPCALGATALAHWDRSGPADRHGRTLFSELVRRAGLAGPVRGMLWYQGEGDTGPGLGETYRERFAAFLADLRTALGGPLPVVVVQVGRYDLAQLEQVHQLQVDPLTVPGWSLVRDALRRAADELADVQLVPAADLPLVDGIHLSRAGQEVLGERLAAAALTLLGGPGRGAACLVSVTASADRTEVRCRWAGVRGGLRLTGPADAEVDGEPAQVGVAGDELVLRLERPCRPGAAAVLGPGLDPRVGAVDGDGWPVPLFGPVPVP